MNFIINLNKKEENKKVGDLWLRVWENLKLQSGAFYWGLNLEGEKMVPVRLTGNSSLRKREEDLCGYELNFFQDSDIADIMMGLRRKLALGTMSVLTFFSIMNVLAPAAQALTQDSVPPSPSVAKAGTSVILSGMDMDLGETVNKRGINLAIYHTNSETDHTNVDEVLEHTNTHVNVEEVPHTNVIWNNLPHVNQPSVAHTNVSEGDVPGDYLY